MIGPGCLSLAYEQAHLGEFGEGWYIMRRRCSRQRELANPVIREGRLNVKKKLHIRQLSLVGFEVFVTAFFPLFP